jgi:hypothetical protein
LQFAVCSLQKSKGNGDAQRTAKALIWALPVVLGSARVESKWLKTTKTRRFGGFFCLPFKHSKLGGVNLTFSGDLYLPLFEGVMGNQRSARG